MIKLLLILLNISISTTPESVQFGPQDKSYVQFCYEDDAHFRKGVELAEKGKHKQALKELCMVQVKNLSRYDETEYYYYRGYCHIKQAEYTSGGVAMKKIIDIESPYREAARYYYGYCLYRQAKYDKALPYLQEQEDLGNYRKSVPYFLTQIYYTQGNDAEAKKRAELLLHETEHGATPNEDTKVNIEELKRILGEIYFREGRYSDALKMLKQVKFKRDSVGEYAYMAMGRCQVELGQINEAKMSYQAAAHIGITPQTKEEAMYNYALCAYKTSTALGEGITAVTDFLEAYPKSKHKNEIQSILCEALLKSKNYQAALNALNEMSEQTPQMAATKQQLRYLLGADAFAQGDMRKTVDWMSEVITLAKAKDDYLTEALYWRAEAEYRLKDFVAAENDIDRYFVQPNVNQSPNRRAAYYLKGYTLMAEKKYEEAREALQVYVDGAVATDEKRTDALCRIADCYYNGRGFQSAIQHYRMVSERGGRQADYALYQEGLAQGLLKQYSEKEEAMKTLVMRYPKSIWAERGWYELARTQVAKGDARNAIPTYEQLLKRYPNSSIAPKASLERAMLYRNLGETDNAIAAYKATVSSYKGTDEAYQSIEALQQIYVANNRLNEYVAYAKTLDKMKMTVKVNEDSLSLATAEGQRMKGRYDNALKEYQHLQKITHDEEYQAAATEGIFHCAKELRNQEIVAAAAGQIIQNENPHTALYAEAVYEKAQIEFQQGMKDAAEQRAMSLLQSNNQHQYWLAKALILVADIEMDRGEFFQAKQYLLTLQRNYNADDDIRPAVESRLSILDEYENQDANQNENENQDEN